MAFIEKVRSRTGTPVAGDFDSGTGSPIVIDETTGKAYVMTSAGAIVDIALTSAQVASLASLSFTGNAGKVVTVNATEDGFELV